MTPALSIPDAGLGDRAWDDMCAELGATLGLDAPVPRRTLEAALADETYAGNLLASRRHPALLQQLIDAPPRARSAGPQLSAAGLARKAAIALGRWAGTGFATVDETVRRTREAACLGCPDRRPAPSSLGTCGLCGCPLGRKIRMTSEACPGSHPLREGQTRWGEPALPPR